MVIFIFFCLNLNGIVVSLVLILLSFLFKFVICVWGSSIINFFFFYLVIKLFLDKFCFKNLFIIWRVLLFVVCLNLLLIDLKWLMFIMVIVSKLLFFLNLVKVVFSFLLYVCLFGSWVRGLVWFCIVCLVSFFL